MINLNIPKYIPGTKIKLGHLWWLIAAAMIGTAAYYGMTV